MRMYRVTAIFADGTEVEAGLGGDAGATSVTAAAYLLVMQGALLDEVAAKCGALVRVEVEQETAHDDTEAGAGQ